MVPRRSFLPVCCFAILFLGRSVSAAEPVPEPSFYDRITHPDRSRKSAYQDRKFNSQGSSLTKTIKTDAYPGVKEFSSKPFVSKAFDGARKGWLGKLLFHEKKLPDNLQATNGDATKQFASKDLPVKSYGDLNKKSGFAGREPFAVRQVTPKGAAQGGIDSDQHLQDAVKKGLSVDDVRNLLNKAP